MNGNNKMNEFVSLATSDIDMQEYFTNISKAVFKITKEQMMNKMSVTINDYKERAKGNQNNGLQMLQAVKPFMDEKTSENIDKLSEVFSDINAIKMFIDSFLESNKNAEEYVLEKTNEKKMIDRQGDLIIEDNTVYEIDEKCEPLVNTQSLNRSSNNKIFAALLYMLTARNDDTTL